MAQSPELLRRLFTGKPPGRLESSGSNLATPGPRHALRLGSSSPT